MVDVISITSTDNYWSLNKSDANGGVCGSLGRRQRTWLQMGVTSLESLESENSGIDKHCVF